MTPKIVLTGAAGKIGGAVLSAILDYDLAKPSDLVIATSSTSHHPLLARAISEGATTRPSKYDSLQVMTEAFKGCERLFMISSTQIDLDFHNARDGGREKHHFILLEAAKQAGISHVYYASLAFSDASKAGVMRAHLVTEDFLRKQKDFGFTIMREGLYHQSWPLYLGYYEVPSDEREKIVIGTDGPISWTAMEDIGLSTAMILTDDSQTWAGKTFWLSARNSLTIAELAILVGKIRGKPLSIESRSQQEYITHYTEDRGKDRGLAEWWSSTYPALQENECKIDDPTLEDLIALKGRKPKPIENTIRGMLGKASSP